MVAVLCTCSVRGEICVLSPRTVTTLIRDTLPQLGHFGARFLREDRIKRQKDWHKGATMTARICSCMLNDVQCSLMWGPHDLYEGDCVVDCTSISQKLFVPVVALSTGSLVHFYVIHRIRKKENWMCSQMSHKKAVSTMASTGHSVEDSFLKIWRAGWSVADGQANALRASGSKKPKPFGSSSHSFQLIPSSGLFDWLLLWSFSWFFWYAPIHRLRVCGVSKNYWIQH